MKYYDQRGAKSGSELLNLVAAMILNSANGFSGYGSQRIRVHALLTPGCFQLFYTSDERL